MTPISNPPSDSPSSPSRQKTALRPPATSELDFTKFPPARVRAGVYWWRQHRDRPGAADRGAWFFASYDPGSLGAGRFDLLKPQGSCYLAKTAHGAMNECLGPDVAERGWVDADLLEGRVMSRLPLPEPVLAANLTSARATRFRVTSEINTVDDYALTQQWATALAAVGFTAIRYWLRFSTDATHGLALFSEAGAPETPPPGDPAPRPLRELVAEAGIEVEEPPSFDAVRITTP